MVIAEHANKVDSSRMIFKNLFNPASSDYINDPYAYYAEVRDKCPVYKTPYGVYILTKHADIQTVLSNKKLIKDYWRPLLKIYGAHCYEESGFALVSRWLINKNPPVHTQIRKLLTAALNSKNTSILRETTELIANELIDGFCENNQTDLLMSYAYKLPALVIFHLLGIPKTDYEFLFKHVSLPSVLLDPRCLEQKVLDDANYIVDELTSYFQELCKIREKELGDDLISLLLRARKSEAIELTDAELISNIFFLFGAGHETAMNLIGNGLYTLYKNPESLAQLKMNWDLMPQAIEEMLRYEAPVQIASPNVTLSPIDLGGLIIPEGAVIMPILGAACRDPAMYPHPDNFNITRKNSRTLAFGFGIHLCLGAQLARLEGAIGIQILLERLPKLTVDLPTSQWKPLISVRGLTGLVGRW
jgi:cytochrome P450